MNKAVWLEYQELFNLNLIWRAGLSCPETRGPEISISEVSFVQLLDIVLENYVLGLVAWVEVFIRPLPSLTEWKWLWCKHSSQEGTPEDWTDGCTFLFYESIMLQRRGWHFNLRVIDNGCIIFLSFLKHVKLNTHTHAYTRWWKHSLFFSWFWLLPAFCENCHYTKKDIDHDFNHCWNHCLILQWIFPELHLCLSLWKDNGV